MYVIIILLVGFVDAVGSGFNPNPNCTKLDQVPFTSMLQRHTIGNRHHESVRVFANPFVDS